MIILLICIGILLIALVIRFVQPELIYSIRQVVMRVRTNKATLDYEAGRSNVNLEWKKQLMDDFRFDTQECDAEYALQRVLKINELYRVLDSRRSTSNKSHDSQDTPKPQVCIIELSNLIGNLSKDLSPRSEYSRSTISARGLLAFIGNEVRRSQGEPDFENEKSIEEWFTENPMSIEQTIEILFAAVYGISYRLRAEPTDKESNQRTPFIDYWTAISRLEKRIRLIVNSVYGEKYQTDETVHARIQKVLGEREYNNCLRRMEQSRKQSTGLALNFLDFLYFVQLESLIFNEWDVFRKAFGEKTWLKNRLEKIVFVRNEAAHNRPIAKPVEMLAMGYCMEIEERIQRFETSRR